MDKIYSKLLTLIKPKNYSLKDYFFTSESVAEGHPDKVCDQISDLILDEYLANDPTARVAVETLAAPNNLVIAGEIKSVYKPEAGRIEQLAREHVQSLGYDQNPFHFQNINIQNLLHEQSPEIAMGVDGSHGKEEGAGDQGIMFGYACHETEELMPAPILYAHRLIRSLMEAVKAKKLVGLGPDGKCQITLEYGANKLPFRADTVVVSIQHSPHISLEEVRDMITPYVLEVLPSGWFTDATKLYVNPTGAFTIGGPNSDTGLTGRKIIVDTYGGAAPHGGGAFSGKDPSKVDRSAAYAARYIAKNIVAAGFADKCLIQISYAIGMAHPLSIYVNTFRTAIVKEERLVKVVSKAMDLTPRGIRNHLKLDRAIYLPTATYGHFGRQPTPKGHFSWEKIDLIDSIKSLIRTV
ncbi:MAG: methionine adenosyltransferase [Rickettsiales bacterium]